MDKAAGETRRLFVYNGGFLWQRRLRRILSLAGYRVSLGRPGPENLVGVWGRSPTAHRGEAMAARHGAGLVRIEDAFLRSVLPGRVGGAPPIGLMIDHRGVHFDAAVPSDLETLLATHPLDDTALLDRSRAAIEQIKALNLSKYNAFHPDLDPPEPGYVLVVDQTLGDASVTASNATPATFNEMLAFAQIEHPGARVLIKTHPEGAAGKRAGHFTPDQAKGRVEFFSDPVSPHALLEGAVGVYTLSSQLGFEAILAGHKPRVFGQPFYAGWGLTQDENPVPRRERRLTRAQLFACAMILAPTWYDPCRDRLCELEDVIAQLHAQSRAWREDFTGWEATGMRLWKRGAVQKFYGGWAPVGFSKTVERARARAAKRGARIMVWASKDEGRDAGLVRVEDGFLRSRGLGAELVPPLSLAADDLGIYYDPSRESRLERLIAASAALPVAEVMRAERLIARLTRSKLSKYNIGGDLPPLPEGHRILVPGQVEDDASIRLGCIGTAQTNLDLLRAAREANPGAVILYKPHPDVEAGLRKGAVPPDTALELADAVLDHADPATLLDAVDEVWTLTSLIGFEALLRGRKVTCLGTPFYAGWGLTTDLAPTPARRQARPGLTGLAHATLIGYPRYRDPVSGLPCPVEVIVERLETDALPRPGPGNRALSKLQGLMASRAHLWR